MCVRTSVFVCMCVCVRPILVFVWSNLIWSDYTISMGKSLFIKEKVIKFQNTLKCKKRSGQELEKGWVEKELKSKWAAKAGVVLVLMRIKF